MTAIFLPCCAVRMWFKSVVFPAPRNPVSTVTGTRGVAVAGIGSVSDIGRTAYRELYPPSPEGHPVERMPALAFNPHSEFRIPQSKKGDARPELPPNRAPRLRNRAGNSPHPG